MSSQPSVSLVIPVLNAEKHLPSLFQALEKQQPSPPSEIVLVDSMSTDRTRELAEKRPDVKVVPIPDFSHGRSRNLGARAASGEIVVLMSQDAEPADEKWLAKLVEPFADPRVALTYSRQIPRPDANPMEKFFLASHFPDGRSVRREKVDGRPIGLGDVFCSNVSAAVRRRALLDHPFDETLIMSEDQQLSRDLIEAGMAVVYQPESVVVHSHNYTLPKVFRRYFDSVYSLTLIFPAHDMKTSAAMGRRYVWNEARFIVRNHPLSLPYYMFYTAAKVGGTLAAHFAEKMPRKMARFMSCHSYHWK